VSSGRANYAAKSIFPNDSEAVDDGGNGRWSSGSFSANLSGAIGNSIKGEQ